MILGTAHAVALRVCTYSVGVLLPGLHSLPLPSSSLARGLHYQHGMLTLHHHLVLSWTTREQVLRAAAWDAYR